MDFGNSITFDTPIKKDLSNDDSTIENIKLCEFDNSINDSNYIYSGLTVTFNYDDFTFYAYMQTSKNQFQIDTTIFKYTINTNRQNLKLTDTTRKDLNDYTNQELLKVYSEAAYTAEE